MAQSENLQRRLSNSNTHFQGIGVENRNSVSHLKAKSYMRIMGSGDFELMEPLFAPTDLDVRDKEDGEKIQ